MKSLNGSSRSRRHRTPPSRRVQLLAAFDRSGLSAAAFARQHGGYTTFCGWRHRRTKAKPMPAFVEVQLSEPAAAVELWVEAGAHAGLRLTSVGQSELGARFLHRFNPLAAG